MECNVKKVILLASFKAFSALVDLKKPRTQHFFLDRGAILEPKQGGTQKTVEAKSQSSDSQGASGPSGSRPNSKGSGFFRFLDF